MRSLEEIVEAEGVAFAFRRGVAVSFMRLWWTGSYRVPEVVGILSSRFRRLGAWRAAEVFALTEAPLVYVYVVFELVDDGWPRVWEAETAETAALSGSGVSSMTMISFGGWPP